MCLRIVSKTRLKETTLAPVKVKKYKHCCGNSSVTLAIPALEDEFRYYKDAIASAKKFHSETNRF